MRVIGFVEGFKKGAHLFGGNIAILINSILLLIVYVIGIGVTSLAAKITGKRFLGMDKKESSYWEDYNLKKKQMEEYYRQF